jgi:C-terminal processing protease CtpA/Prc
MSPRRSNPPSKNTVKKFTLPQFPVFRSKKFMRKTAVILIAIMLALFSTALAQDEGPTPAEIINDEGGPVSIVGGYYYSDPDLPNYGSQPVVFLGDVSNLFVEGGFEFSTEYLNLSSPQVMARLTSNIHEGPLGYEFRLPIDLGGVLTDVDNDDTEDPGVMIYTVNFTFNGVGDVFIDDREFIYYSSVTSSQDYETLYELNGGTVLIFAPEEGQGFPSGFGDDGMLFSEDDPIVIVPQGYTVVNMDSDTFTFDRSQNAVINVVESEGTEFTDFSGMGYTEAFDAMIEMMRNEYAFTEFKGIDWDAMVTEFRPRFEEAEANEDSTAYFLAVRDFEWSIPDTHIGSNAFNGLVDLFFEETDGGLGLAIRKLDDGSVIVNYLMDGGPAAEAGIEMMSEILEVNGQAIGDAIDASVPWSSPFSSDHFRQLQQLRYVIRFPVDTEVKLLYKNPGADGAVTVTLTTIAERDSFGFSSFNVGLTGFELPLEFEVLDSGYGYIKIYGFNDDNLLTLTLWQRAIRNFNAAGIHGLIIDMRQNGGGSPDIGNVMLGSFIDEELYAGTSAFYFADIDDFAFDENYETVITPAGEEDRYYGDVTVLIGPNCISMCEFFTYALALNDRAQVVGQYPTAGGGGGIKTYAMPDGIFAQFTVGRGVGADNEIHIEGTGVVPTVQVPVTEETLFSEDDVILEYAVAYLDEATGLDIVDGGEIFIGDTITGEIDVNQSVRYTMSISAGDAFNVYVGDESGQFDTVLRIYAEDGETLYVENDDFSAETVNSGFEGLEGDMEEIIVIEVATYENALAGVYVLEIVPIDGE